MFALIKSSYPLGLILSSKSKCHLPWMTLFLIHKPRVSVLVRDCDERPLRAAKRAVARQDPFRSIARFWKSRIRHSSPGSAMSDKTIARNRNRMYFSNALPVVAWKHARNEQIIEFRYLQEKEKLLQHLQKYFILLCTEK